MKISSVTNKVLTTVLILTIPSTSFGVCRDTPQLCDKIITESQQLIKKQDEQIKDYSQQSELQKLIIKDKDAMLQSPLRNPVVVGSVGVALTVLTLALTGRLK